MKKKNITYIEAIELGFPNVKCYAKGDGSVYENLVWAEGDPIPPKNVLDNWILTNQSSFQFNSKDFYMLTNVVESSTTSTTYQNKIRLMTYPLSELIIYRVGWYCELRVNSTSVGILSRVLINKQQVSQIRLTLRNTADYFPYCGFYYLNLTEPTAYEIELQWCVNGAATGYIRNAQIEVFPIIQ